jgi:signal recognition particle receptor subunit beta
MPTVNEETLEVQFKLVFSGSALSGKTSNVAAVHAALDEEQRGDLISLNTSSDRTLFFDYLPVNPVLIEGYQTKFLLYTVPGQVVYNATRELVLRGVDGLVFVADSDPDRWDANMEAWQNLLQTLQNNGRDLSEIPLVFQYNKRDLPNAVPLAELERQLNPHGFPAFEAAAPAGKGVLETLEVLSSEVLRRFHLRREEEAREVSTRHGQPITSSPVPWIQGGYVKSKRGLALTHGSQELRKPPCSTLRVLYSCVGKAPSDRRNSMPLAFSLWPPLVRRRRLPSSSETRPLGVFVTREDSAASTWPHFSVATCCSRFIPPTPESETCANLLSGSCLGSISSSPSPAKRRVPRRPRILKFDSQFLYLHFSPRSPITQERFWTERPRPHSPRNSHLC